VVRRSVTTVNHAKAAELIVMLSEMSTRMSSRNHALDGVQIPTREEEIGQFLGRTGDGHAGTRWTVDILKATQQGSASVRCGCR